MNKFMMLASLLGDNPNRAFSFDELRMLLKSVSKQAVYIVIFRLRQAGMNIEVKNNMVTYKGKQ